MLSTISANRFLKKNSGSPMPVNPVGLIKKEAGNVSEALPLIKIAAHRIAATIMQGVHGRRRVGPGDSFWQFRQYQKGDPITRIDWKQTARRTHAFIRENEWEIAQSVWIWVDRSKSMEFSSETGIPEKSLRAAILAFALCLLLVRGGERVTLFGSGIKPRSDRAGLEQMASFLAQAPLGNEKTFPTGDGLPRHAQIILISDFLQPITEIEASIRGLASQGFRGHLLQVHDPSEQDFPFTGRVQFDGMEGEGSMVIGRSENVRSEFNRLMAEHCRVITDIALACGWGSTKHLTSSAAENALLAIYNAVGEKVEARRHA
jgi:uncharacterized protein (DUF58 family)